ncbi:hypothetical protein BDR26DRAFT_594651 [Obelidium mucronatum]|nr:hypothetical protein BDR26DRAFT_594651 [Obelidium mucronatum]
MSSRTNNYEQLANRAPIPPINDEQSGSKRIYSSALKAALSFGKTVATPDPNAKGKPISVPAKRHEAMKSSAKKPLGFEKPSLVVNTASLHANQRKKQTSVSNYFPQETKTLITKIPPSEPIDLCESDDDDKAGAAVHTRPDSCVATPSAPSMPNSKATSVTDDESFHVDLNENEEEDVFQPVKKFRSDVTRNTSNCQQKDVSSRSANSLYSPIPIKSPGISESISAGSYSAPQLASVQPRGAKITLKKPKRIENPVIEPWAVDLFSQTLDLFNMTLPGAEFLIERLIHSFFDPEMIQFRRSRLQEIKDGPSMGCEINGSSDDPMQKKIISWYIRFFSGDSGVESDEVWNPSREDMTTASRPSGLICFQAPLLIGLSAVLATCPKKVLAVWTELGGSLDTTSLLMMEGSWNDFSVSSPTSARTTPHNSISSLANASDVIDVDEVMGSPSPPTAPPPPSTYSHAFDIDRINEILRPNRQSLASTFNHKFTESARYSTKLVKEVSEGIILAAVPGGVNGNATEDEFAYFERLWGGDCSTAITEIMETVEKSAMDSTGFGSIGVRVDKPAYEDLFNPLDSEELRGCTCDTEGALCASMACSCITAMNNPAFNNDALRDCVSTTVIECGDACACSCAEKSTCTNGTKALNSYLRQNMLKGLVVKASSCEWGLFTSEMIAHGTYIGDYIGNIIGTTGIEIRQAMYKKTSLIQRDMLIVRHNGIDQFGIDATYSCNYTRFINHSCKPNCRAILIYTRSKTKKPPRVAIFALRTIPGNTELTINYSALDVGGPEYSGECTCGESPSLCKGIVGKRKRVEYEPIIEVMGSGKKKRGIKKRCVLWHQQIKKVSYKQIWYNESRV